MFQRFGTLRTWAEYAYTVSENASTLANCSFDRHGLILISFW